MKHDKTDFSTDSTNIRVSERIVISITKRVYSNGQEDESPVIEKELNIIIDGRAFTLEAHELYLISKLRKFIMKQLDKV